VADKDKYGLYLPTAEKIIDSLKITTQGITSKDYDECARNGMVAPCIGDNGGIVYYCDDPKSAQSGSADACLPSSKAWANFLPGCSTVNYNSSCSSNGKALFACDDPEFHIEKYPYGCLENRKLTKNPKISSPLPLPLAPPEEQAKYAPCDYSVANLKVPCLEKDGSITFDCNDKRFLASKFAAGCTSSDAPGNITPQG
jgi:hypothetical protein